MFGPDLLAAPVIEPDAGTRRLYLPRGRWIDLGDPPATARAPVRSRCAGQTSIRGGREVRLPAPLDELPLLVRPGAIIPMLIPTSTRWPTSATVVDWSRRPIARGG